MCDLSWPVSLVIVCLHYIIKCSKLLSKVSIVVSQDYHDPFHNKGNSILKREVQLCLLPLLFLIFAKFMEHGTGAKNCKSNRWWVTSNTSGGQCFSYNKGKFRMSLP